MAVRRSPVFFLSTLLVAGNVLAASAAPLPAPKEPLRDFRAAGVVQIDIPPNKEVKGDPGMRLWFPMEQSFVWPDRHLLVMNLFGSIQASLVMGATERSYNPVVGILIERTYKNLEQAPENPLNTLQLSMGTYAKLLREIEGGSLQEEDLDKLEVELKKRSEELAALRKKLKESKEPEDLARAQDAASEHVRVTDELKQIPVRRKNPCYLAEYKNKEFLRHLIGKGLVSVSASDRLSDGRTRVWVTKQEGLPLKIETTDNDGRVVVFICLTEVRINTGLRSSDVVLQVPPGAPQARVIADLRDPHWEERMEKDLEAQVQRIEKARKEFAQGDQPAYSKPPKRKQK